MQCLLAQFKQQNWSKVKVITKKLKEQKKQPQILLAFSLKYWKTCDFADFYSIIRTKLGALKGGKNEERKLIKRGKK